MLVCFTRLRFNWEGFDEYIIYKTHTSNIMKKHLFLAFVTVLMIGISTSCTQEENLTELEEVTIVETESRTPASTTERVKRKKLFWGYPNVTPCGYGFNFTIYADAAQTIPLTGGSNFYYYKIKEVGTTGPNYDDEGPISHGNNTNWVLAPCTDYIFYLHYLNGNGTLLETIQVTSDGCGNLFVC